MRLLRGSSRLIDMLVALAVPDKVGHARLVVREEHLTLRERQWLETEKFYFT